MIRTIEGVAVLGAGGHAKVVVSTLQDAGLPVVMAFDDDETKWGRTLLGVPVAGPLESFAASGWQRAIIAIGNNRDRKRWAERLQTEWVTVVHPTAWVHSSVRLGAGTVVFAGAVVQAGTSVGTHAIVNTGAVIDHDCSISAFAHLAPRVGLAGGVTVGEGALLGIGSVATPGSNVGAWAIVGAGAVVVDDVPADATVAGVPARATRRRGR